MKNLIKYIAIICLLLAAHTSSSQSFTLGVKGGVNYASISSLNSEGRIGFTGGAFMGLRFNAIAVQTEFLFSQQGGRFLENDIETDYALIPLIMKLHFLRIFNLQFGPQFSYLIDGSDILESERLDLSGAVGLGLSLGSSLHVDMRYNFGFTDAFKGASGNNRFISVALGLSFL